MKAPVAWMAQHHVAANLFNGGDAGGKQGLVGDIPLREIRPSIASGRFVV